MNVLDYILPFAIGAMGIVLGSILNYFILKRLFRGQVSQVLNVFEGTETGEKIAELIDKLSKFVDSEDAKRVFGKLEKALDDLIGDEEQNEN